MNLKEIKNSLDRLNRYFEFMNSSPDKISSIDRDSFLQQLRDIYDLVLHSETNSPPVSQEEAPVVKETPKKEEKKTTKKAPKLIFNQQETKPKEEPPVKKEVAPVKVEEAAVEQKEEKKEEPKAEVKEKPVEKEKPEVQEPPKEEKKPVVQEQPEVKEEESPDNSNGQSANNEEYGELFVFKEATDLAAKLSESPITNLNQSLGLNEKFHYINELFGGDVASFKTAIDYFNEAGNMEKARTYTESHLIEQFGWMKKEKKSLAKDFIKFIRRRYL